MRGDEKMLSIAELSTTKILDVAAMPGKVGWGYDKAELAAIATEAHRHNEQPSVPAIADDDALRADHTVPSPLPGLRSPPACSRKPDHFHNIEDVPSCKVCARASLILTIGAGQ